MSSLSPTKIQTQFPIDKASVQELKDLILSGITVKKLNTKAATSEREHVMSNAYETIARYIAGVGLVTISFFKLYTIFNSGIYIVSMLSMCVTEDFMTEATNVFVLWMAAVGLFAGVKTRIVALFSLCLVGVQTLICFSQMQNGTMSGHLELNLQGFDILFLITLFTSLIICIVKGRGSLSLRVQNWNRAVPK